MTWLAKSSPNILGWSCNSPSSNQTIPNPIWTLRAVTRADLSAAAYRLGGVSRTESAELVQAILGEIIAALHFTLAVIENEVPAKAFAYTTGPDADGDDANAAYLVRNIGEVIALLKKLVRTHGSFPRMGEPGESKP